MRLGIFAYADTAAVPWGGFFEVPFLGGDNYSPVQAVRYRRILIKIYHQLTRAHKPERLVQSVKKVAECHFFEFYGFCLSHSLPGGKIRKVRKPLGFHPF